MRILDPLGTEATINRLQSRLLYPVNSIAITQRLRYLSFWAWITSHVDRHDRESRKLYEKVYLFANVAHDCDDEGTHGKGIVSASRTAADGVTIRDRYDPSAEFIDISPEAFTMSTNRSGFDQYYKGILYNLLLFENEWTLSKPGEELAAAFEDAVDIEFTDLQAAVDDQRVSVDLVDRFAADGCLCLLPGREREILSKAFLGLFTNSTTWDGVELLDRVPESGFEVERYLEHEGLAEQLIEFNESAAIEEQDARLDILEASDVANLTDLEQYMISGQHVFARATVLLLLYTGYWVTERPSQPSRFGDLSAARNQWRLIIHSEYFSQACQTILIALYEALRVLGRTASDELVSQLVSHSAFGTAVAQGLESDLESVADDSDTLQRIKDALYYGRAFETVAGATISTSDSVLSDLRVGDPWATFHECVREQLAAKTPTVGFERVLLTLVNQRTDEPASLAKSARLIGYATLLLVTLQARYSQEYAGDAFTPYQRWFQQTQRYPSAKLLWTERFDSEQPLPNAATEFITRHIVEQYFSRLYEKIADQPGKSPQVMSRDADDILSFERRYNGGKPNLPTLKYDRLGDIFFELDWITTDSLHEFESTPRAEAVLAQLVNFEGLE